MECFRCEACIKQPTPCSLQSKRNCFCFRKMFSKHLAVAVVLALCAQIPASVTGYPKYPESDQYEMSKAQEISPFHGLIGKIGSTLSRATSSSTAAPEAGAIQFPGLFPPRPGTGRLVPGQRSSSGAVLGGSASTAVATTGSTGRPPIHSSTATARPIVRGNSTNFADPAATAALEKAMLFTVCPETASETDRAYVNWIPSWKPNDNSTSWLQYQLCSANSLQPRLITGFGLVNKANPFGSNAFSTKTDICGPLSTNKVRCLGRVTRQSPCLSGTVQIEVPFDARATQASLLLLTTPPATSVIRLCL